MLPIPLYGQGKIGLSSSQIIRHTVLFETLKNGKQKKK